MSDESWYGSLDAWKTASEDPGTVGRGSNGLAYRCLDCGWTGRGGVAATEHHRQAGRHHRLQVRNGPVAVFGCCSELAGASTYEATPNAGGKDRS